jgi:hypothetical protein
MPVLGAFTFDKTVELRFSVNPAVRPAKHATFCIGGPSGKPHILFQQILKPGGHQPHAPGAQDEEQDDDYGGKPGGEQRVCHPKATHMEHRLGRQVHLWDRKKQVPAQECGAYRPQDEPQQ